MKTSCSSHLSFLVSFLLVPLVLISLLSLPFEIITEQYTELLPGLDTCIEQASDMDTNLLPETVESSQTIDSSNMSLVDTFNEIIIQDSSPEDIEMNASVKADEIEPPMSTATVNVHG